MTRPLLLGALIMFNAAAVAESNVDREIERLTNLLHKRLASIEFSTNKSVDEVHAFYISDPTKKWTGTAVFAEIEIAPELFCEAEYFVYFGPTHQMARCNWSLTCHRPSRSFALVKNSDCLQADSP